MVVRRIFRVVDLARRLKQVLTPLCIRIFQVLKPHS